MTSIECSPLGDNFRSYLGFNFSHEGCHPRSRTKRWVLTPRGQLWPLGVNFSPGGKTLSLWVNSCCNNWPHSTVFSNLRSWNPLPCLRTAKYEQLKIFTYVSMCALRHPHTTFEEKGKVLAIVFCLKKNFFVIHKQTLSLFSTTQALWVNSWKNIFKYFLQDRNWTSSV
jgi:hypothetical protein